jgi:hypothetical protein
MTSQSASRGATYEVASRGTSDNRPEEDAQGVVSHFGRLLRRSRPPMPPSPTNGRTDAERTDIAEPRGPHVSPPPRYLRSASLKERG